MSGTDSARIVPETDFDHHAPHLAAGHDEVLGTYAELRAQCPMVHSSAHGGFFTTTDYQALREVLGDAARFSAGEAGGVLLPHPHDEPKIVPLEYEGPEHKKWRDLMMPPLTQSAVRQLRPVIEDIVNAQIDDFARDGKADLVSAIAEPVPALVIARMVGLSEAATPRMRELGEKMVASQQTPERPQVTRDFFGFIAEELEARRQKPRDDYLSQLAAGALGARPLTDEEVGGILMSYFIGGHHSTTAAIAGLMHHILTEDGVREAIADDPYVLRKVVEESLRLSTPLAHFARTVLEDTEVEGAELPAGSRILLNYVSANRDERTYEDPERFDFNRNSSPHVAFGYGTHLCIGRHLARAEMATTATLLLQRLPDLAVDGEVRFSGLIGGTLRKITKFPVRFTPGPAAA